MRTEFHGKIHMMGHSSISNNQRAQQITEEFLIIPEDTLD